MINASENLFNQMQTLEAELAAAKVFKSDDPDKLEEQLKKYRSIESKLKHVKQRQKLIERNVSQSFITDNKIVINNFINFGTAMSFGDGNGGITDYIPTQINDDGTMVIKPIRSYGR